MGTDIGMATLKTMKLGQLYYIKIQFKTLHLALQMIIFI